MSEFGQCQHAGCETDADVGLNGAFLCLAHVEERCQKAGETIRRLFGGLMEPAPKLCGHCGEHEAIWEGVCDNCKALGYALPKPAPRAQTRYRYHPEPGDDD